MIGKLVLAVLDNFGHWIQGVTELLAGLLALAASCQVKLQLTLSIGVDIVSSLPRG